MVIKRHVRRVISTMVLLCFGLFNCNVQLADWIKISIETKLFSSLLKYSVLTRFWLLLGIFVDRMNPLAQFWRVTQTVFGPQLTVSGSRTGGRYMLML